MFQSSGTVETGAADNTCTPLMNQIDTAPPVLDPHRPGQGIVVRPAKHGGIAIG
jgi:hypothetical protein